MAENVFDHNADDLEAQIARVDEEFRSFNGGSDQPAEVQQDTGRLGRLRGAAAGLGNRLAVTVVPKGAEIVRSVKRRRRVAVVGGVLTAATVTGGLVVFANSGGGDSEESLASVETIADEPIRGLVPIDSMVVETTEPVEAATTVATSTTVAVTAPATTGVVLPTQLVTGEAPAPQAPAGESASDSGSGSEEYGFYSPDECAQNTIELELGSTYYDIADDCGIAVETIYASNEQYCDPNNLQAGVPIHLVDGLDEACAPENTPAATVAATAGSQANTISPAPATTRPAAPAAASGAPENVVNYCNNFGGTVIAVSGDAQSVLTEEYGNRGVSAEEVRRLIFNNADESQGPNMMNTLHYAPNWGLYECILSESQLRARFPYGFNM